MFSFYWDAALKQKIPAAWAREPNCFVFFPGRCLTEAEREQQQKEIGRKPSFCCDQNLKGSRDILQKLLDTGRETQTSAQTHVGSTRESDGRIPATLANQKSLSIPDTNRDVMAGIMQIKPISRLSEIISGGKLYGSIQQSSGQNKS